jgi:hypothetical protein
VETWRDRAGGVIAHGYVNRGWPTLAFPGEAVFRFSSEGGPVCAVARPHLSREEIRDTYLRTVLPLVLQVRGAEVLHASAVWLGEGVVAFCAVSETGKSTLAAALGRSGYAVWADDAVVVSVAEQGVRVLPLPFRSRLRAASRAWLGETGDGHFRCAPQEGPLRAIFFLERREERPLGARPLPPADAFPALLRHAYCFSLQDVSRTRQMVERYMELACRVPAFELTFPSGLAHLPAMVDAVEQMLGS